MRIYWIYWDNWREEFERMCLVMVMVQTGLLCRLRCDRAIFDEEFMWRGRENSYSVWNKMRVNYGPLRSSLKHVSPLCAEPMRLHQSHPWLSYFTSLYSKLQPKQQHWASIMGPCANFLATHSRSISPPCKINLIID